VRSIRRARVAAAVVGVLAGGLLTGCGIADEGVQPGVAAEVGDTTISLDEVEDAAEQLCDLRGQDPATKGVPVSGAEVRTRALQTLVLRSIADGLAEEYEITPSPTFASLEDAAEDEGSVQARQTVGLSYFVSVMQAVGAQVSDAGAAEQDQLAAGIAAAQAWTDREGVQTNPVFPEIEIGDVAVEFTRDDDLSVAVSEFAEEALGDADRLAEQQGDSAYAATLPESQRCG
jgi:hypothetical protein